MIRIETIKKHHIQNGDIRLHCILNNLSKKASKNVANEFQMIDSKTNVVEYGN